MSDFNKICKIVEGLDPLEYSAMVAAKTVKIMPALCELSGDKLDAAGLFASFLIASVYADGKLDEAEYLLMLPMLKLVFGTDFDYGAAKALVKEFKPEGKELKNTVDAMVDVLGAVSPELKDDIIIVCLLVCAIDGKISHREKAYIKQLIR